MVAGCGEWRLYESSPLCSQWKRKAQNQAIDLSKGGQTTKIHVTNFAGWLKLCPVGLKISVASPLAMTNSSEIVCCH
ncbi:hypothetical protein CCP2SC5_220004 [Azospirillaceae bacterium]